MESKSIKGCVEGGDFLCVIDGIFTKEECRDLIDRAEKIGWHEPQTGGKYLRAIAIDEKLAEDVFNRIKEYLPESDHGYTLEYINSHFRFSKYRAGGKFDIHCDGKNIDLKMDANGYNYEAVMTLNIFLNDNFEGGETDFFTLDGNVYNLRHRVEPKTGRGALFYHDQWHRGNVVKTPYKYLIRTDVMGIKK